ncbi:MAG: HD-GYP domain-containing protein [Tepidisphaeraceae bacterium]
MHSRLLNIAPDFSVMTQSPNNGRLSQVIGLFNALNCGALLIDRDGIIVHANSRVCSMLARTADEMAGANVRSFYSDPKDLAYLDDALARSDQPRDSEFHLPRADGTSIPVVTSARPLSAPLDDLHIVTAIDISPQKRVEEDYKENLRLVSQLSDTLLEQAVSLKNYSAQLEEKVRQRTEQIRQANLDAIYMLAVASEAKDADTGRHVRRIQRFAEALSLQLGLGADESYAIGYSAILHDVGKIHIPDDILKKPGPLDESEKFIMRQHTLFGERILGRGPFFERARRIARSHHENIDGSGYPDGLQAHYIPLEARIVHVVDVYDALTSQRIYKPPWPPEKALQHIIDAGGKQFDAEVVKAFESLSDAGDLPKLAMPEDVTASV